MRYNDVATADEELTPAEAEQIMKRLDRLDRQLELLDADVEMLKIMNQEQTKSMSAVAVEDLDEEELAALAEIDPDELAEDLAELRRIFEEEFPRERLSDASLVRGILHARRMYAAA